MTDLSLTSFLATTAAYLRMSNPALGEVSAIDNTPGTIASVLSRPQVDPGAIGPVEASRRLPKLA